MLHCLFFSRFYEFLLSFFAVVVVIAVVVVVTMLVYFPCGSFLRISFFYGIFFTSLLYLFEDLFVALLLRTYLLNAHKGDSALSMRMDTRGKKGTHTETQSTHQIYEICISVFYATSLFVLSHSSAYHFSHSPSHSRPFFPTPNTMCASCFFHFFEAFLLFVVSEQWNSILWRKYGFEIQLRINAYNRN